MPATSRGQNRIPYEFSVTPRVCGCRQPARVLGTGRNLDRLVIVAEGYWNVYLAFFGDQQVWLTWLVTDVRDGRIMWRDGRRTTEEALHGSTSDNG